MSKAFHTHRYSILMRSVATLFALVLSVSVQAAPVKALVGYAVYPSGHSLYKAIPGAERDANLILKVLGEIDNVRRPVRKLSSMAEQEWEAMIKDYVDSLGPSDIAFVYISAHGFRDQERTYFVDSQFKPVQADPFFQKIMNTAKASIFFIDICRTAAGDGMKLPAGPPIVGKNTVILFSTDAGVEAKDADHSDGKNSKFARAAADEIIEPQELRVTLRNIVAKVSDPEVHGIQNPWPYGIITFDVFLAGEEERPPR